MKLAAKRDLSTLDCELYILATNFDGSGLRLSGPPSMQCGAGSLRGLAPQERVVRALQQPVQQQGQQNRSQLSCCSRTQPTTRQRHVAASAAARDAPPLPGTFAGGTAQPSAGRRASRPCQEAGAPRRLQP